MDLEKAIEEQDKEIKQLIRQVNTMKQHLELALKSQSHLENQLNYLISTLEFICNSKQ